MREKRNETKTGTKQKTKKQKDTKEKIYIQRKIKWIQIRNGG